MVYIYLPAAYYHLNLNVTKESLLAAGFSAVPAVFLVGVAFKLRNKKTIIITLQQLLTNMYRHCWYNY